MLHITKKTFAAKSVVIKYSHNVNVLFFDWQSGYSKEAGSFAGYKYAIGIECCNKRDLINGAYTRIVLNEEIVHANGCMFFRVAITDRDRFKQGMSLKGCGFVHTQDDFAKTSYYEMDVKRYRNEREHDKKMNLKESLDDLPF